MRVKNLLNIVGETINGDPVISGIMKFRESYGLPLEDIFEKVKNEGVVISWYDLVDEAKSIGVNKEKFIPEIKTAILDVYGNEYLETVWDYILKRFEEK
jgi:hypothetical protein